MIFVAIKILLITLKINILIYTTHEMTSVYDTDDNQNLKILNKFLNNECHKNIKLHR